MLDYIASRYDQFLKDLETIVNIDSGSRYAPGIRKIVAYFQDRFSKLGWYTQAPSFADGDVPCLEAANVDPRAPDVGFDFLFLGHMDTVPGRVPVRIEDGIRDTDRLAGALGHLDDEAFEFFIGQFI